MKRLAGDLYRVLAGELAPAGSPPTNLVFSPASIAIAVAMVREGAAGATAAQIDAVLGTTGRSELVRAVLALIELTGPGHGGGDDELAVANALFVQRGYAFVARFLDTMRESYDGALHSVDYSSDADGARNEINAWVDTATRHRIPSLLGPGSIGVDTRMTIVNAIYMKARWRQPFPRESTAPADFTGADGSVRAVPTMRRTGTFAHAAGRDWRAIELPYTSSLSMVVVVPDSVQSMRAAVALCLSPPAMHEARVALALPKFQAATATSLVPALGALGMADAFGLSTADFSGITTSEPMCIGEVVHQANLTADEEGTEAAAATAVAAAGAAMATEAPIPFVVDRAFAFAVHDRPSGTVLFAGHVGDPTPGSR